jgi:hypothetical protein
LGKRGREQFHFIPNCLLLLSQSYFLKKHGLKEYLEASAAVMAISFAGDGRGFWR